MLIAFGHLRAGNCICPFHSRPSTVPAFSSAAGGPKSTARCPGFFESLPAIKETPALAVQVTQVIDLQPVSQHAKEQMAGQVRGRDFELRLQAQLSRYHIFGLLPVPVGPASWCRVSGD
jgi:hypothetical protein